MYLGLNPPWLFRALPGSSKSPQPNPCWKGPEQATRAIPFDLYHLLWHMAPATGSLLMAALFPSLDKVKAGKSFDLSVDL